MKKFLIAFLVIISFVYQSGFSQIFKEKDKVINFGIGAGTSLYDHGNYTSTLPPISCSFEYGMQDGIGAGSLGLGGFIGVTASKYERKSDSTSYNTTYSVIGIKSNYHLTDLAENLDIYFGISLGYSINTSSALKTTTTGISPKSSFSQLSFLAGGRYFLTDNIALMAELGYGFTYFNAGIALKL